MSSQPILRTVALAAVLAIMVSSAIAVPVAATSGPALIRDLRVDGPANPQSLTAVGNRVFFSADDGVKGRELYVSDGTFDGTKRVKDIWTGSGSSNPTGLTAMGNRVFFVARDGVNGAGLYVSDGTNAGTKRLAKRRSCGTEAEELLVHNSLLYYAAYDNVAVECTLYRSDGTVGGTFAAVPGIEFFLEPRSFGGRIYFAGGYSPTNGDLWKSDGTPAGTKKIKTVPSGWIGGLTVAGQYLYFVAADAGSDHGRLWRSNGTSAGTKAIGSAALAPRAPSSLTAFDGRLFFSAMRIENNSPVDDGLWKSNGTAKGTKLIEQIGGGSGCVDPHQLKATESLLFFVACDSNVQHLILWASNGTASGTSIVAELGLGAFDSATMGSLYFVTNGGLTQSDGTAGGTVAVGGVGNVANLEAAGQTLLFTASPGELYGYTP